jgi:putative phosphoribosyl transferase
VGAGGAGAVTQRRAEEEAGHDLLIDVGDVDLRGDLAVPAGARGIVLFAHGSGSGRRSPRNRQVAATLREAGLATLLFDLLTADEEEVDRRSGDLRFDINLLADRLAKTTDWLVSQPNVGRLPVGYFGASTGGGAALVAAARRPELVWAVVSRGGRPDLAGDALTHVEAPTLLIVGELDPVVLDLNQRALEVIPATKDLVVVPGASHLFEEPGTLEQVARHAAGWFGRHLRTEGDDPGEGT